MPLSSKQPTLALSALITLMVGLFHTPLFAVEVAPALGQVEKAIARGETLKKEGLDKLFSPYEFGKRGIGTNGYVLTKLFEITARSVEYAKQGKKLSPKACKDIVEKNHLLIPIYLFNDSKSSLRSPEVWLMQEDKKIPAADVLKDPVKKAACVKGSCFYKRDIFAGFYYKNFDATKDATLFVKYAGKTERFDLALSSMR